MKSIILVIAIVGFVIISIGGIERANQTITNQNETIANLEARLSAYRYDMQRAQPYIKVDTMFVDGRPGTIIVKIRRPELLDPSILMLAATPEDSGSWSIRVVERGEEEGK